MPSDRLHFRDVRNLSTFRLTLWFGLLFALGVAVLLGAIYTLTARELNARSDRILRLEAERLNAMPPDSLPAAILSDMANSTSRLNYFALQSRDGITLVGNIHVPIALHIDRPQDIVTVPGLPPSIRVLAVRTSLGRTLFIGRDITPLIDLRHRMVVILVGSGVTIALLVLAGGIALSIVPLRRVRALERAGRVIAAGDFTARMPILGRGDELDQFAGIVNVMVDEVARVMTQVKDVTDVVAHDLRMPLARVRNQLWRARQLSSEGSEVDAAFATALADINSVLDRFSALLRIAELEASRRGLGFGPVALQPLLVAAGELYQPLAEDRNIRLTVLVEEQIAIQGDGKLLFEAVSNLIDNAIKFAPSGGNVIVSAQAAAHGVTIKVQDDGPGIPVAERESVLRRFQRGSNASGISGLGIGLSAVMAIVHMHGFTLSLHDATPGLIVRIHCRD